MKGGSHEAFRYSGEEKRLSNPFLTNAWEGRGRRRQAAAPKGGKTRGRPSLIRFVYLEDEGNPRRMAGSDSVGQDHRLEALRFRAARRWRGRTIPRNTPKPRPRRRPIPAAVAPGRSFRRPSRIPLRMRVSSGIRAMRRSVSKPAAPGTRPSSSSMCSTAMAGRAACLKASDGRIIGLSRVLPGKAFLRAGLLYERSCMSPRAMPVSFDILPERSSFSRFHPIDRVVPPGARILLQEFMPIFSITPWRKVIRTAV